MNTDQLRLAIENSELDKILDYFELLVGINDQTIPTRESLTAPPSHLQFDELENTGLKQ